MEQGAVSIGMGGWEHDCFDHCFYPQTGLGSQQKLAFYAQHFDMVEVRQTFWDDTLGATEAREWMDAVRNNRRFTFVIKLHASLTHKKIIQPAQTRRTRGLLQELARGDRLGAVLLQFPYSFTNTSSNRYHVIRLSELFSGFPLHVEFRHASWDTPALPGFLTDHSLSLVFADLPRVKQFMPFSGCDAPISPYLRLHGRNEKGWLLNGWDTRYDYLYNTREMREMKRRVDVLCTRSQRILITFNNTTAGKSIVNACQLLSALHARDVVIPSATGAAFPALFGGAPAGDATPGQHEALTYRMAM